jgi:hypothetical protein
MNSLTKVTRVGLLTLLLVVVGISAQASEWQRGDVLVAIGGGQYQLWRQTGTGEGGPIYTLIETLTDGSGSVSGENGSGGNGFTTGCAFDSTSHLYTTNFSNTKAYKFSIPDPHSVSQTIDTNAAAPGGDSESIVFDGSGNFLVGNPDFHPGGDLTKAVVLQYSPAGTLLNTFTVATENRGSDWVELSADGSTLYYTSEGLHIKTFDLVHNAQGADLNANIFPGSFAYALRLLPQSLGGGFLLADQEDLVRLDSSGNVVQSYFGAQEESSWFALNLDTNGTSFWAGDGFTGNLYRFGITSGTIEVGPLTTVPFNLGNATGLGGICVKTVSLTPTNNTGTVNNDNNSNSWQITLNGLTTNATATIAFTEVAPSAGVSDSGRPCELASADGTKCTVHQVSVDVDPTFYSSIDFYHHWNFKPTMSINPRMIKNGSQDITTAVYLDPGTKGHTNTPSTYTDNEAPNPTGSSCGFIFPPNNFTWEAEYPLAFLFRAVATGTKCRKGPFLTTLSPVISVGQLVSGTVVPVTLPSTAFQLLPLDKKTWFYVLTTSTLSPGAYVVSVFDQSNQIPAFSEQINIVPED